MCEPLIDFKIVCGWEAGILVEGGSIDSVFPCSLPGKQGANDANRVVIVKPG